jgi:alpha-1,2-mannosyltransferase
MDEPIPASVAAAPRARTFQLALPLAAVVVVGVALRTLVWWPSHNLFGVLEYDDGVYYAAARLLLDGYLPYSDFSIVHPPGVSLVLLPAAVVGYFLGDPIGMVAGRVQMQLVVALNIVLVYRLAALLPGDPGTRSRRALVAAGLYAVMPNAIVAGQTILLEPLATCACLAAVWFLLRQDQPRRVDLVTCGMFLVVGVSLKLFALAYVAAVVGYLLWTRRPGWLLPLAGGGLLAMAVVIAPFVVSAPARAWHDVVVTQLSRARNSFVPVGLDRVVNMVGLAGVTIPLALVLIALLVVISFRRFDPQAGLWVSVLVITVLAFATSPTYFSHYGEFLGPAVALLVSRALDIRRGALIAMAFAVAFVIDTGVSLSDLRGQEDLRAATSAIAHGSCVYTDSISLPLMAGVYTAPSPLCPSYVDGRGVALTQNTTWDNRVNFYPNGFVTDKCWQEANVEQMTHADYLLLRFPPPTFPEWDGSTRAYVLSHFTLAERHRNDRQPFELWKRTTPPAHDGVAPKTTPQLSVDHSCKALDD